MGKKIVQNLLARAGITINGNEPWDIIVHNDNFYKRLIKNTDLAFGESYMDKWWDCANIDQLIYRIMKQDLGKALSEYPLFWQSNLKTIFFEGIHRLFNFQSKRKALKVGQRHYDIGNDLYEAMLDKRMVYTCAYWEDANNLDEAQERKLELVCQKLYLKPGMTVLDVGCGWGSFVKYAAENYGISAVGITVSERQCDLGMKINDGLPVEIRFQDYRELMKNHEQFDRVVSLGMFEHVGYKNYANYMKCINQCLKDDGLFLLHTIGTNKTSPATNKWIDTYIFPNGQIPSIKEIGSTIEGRFIMEDWQNIGVHYDKTLTAWYENFNKNWDQLKHQYDERFKRMWDFYLLSCAAGFRARQLQLWQVVLSKKGLQQGFQRIHSQSPRRAV